MSSNDKPPVMVELPDDAIEALIEDVARQCCWSVQGVTGGPLYDSLPEWRKAEYRRAVERTVKLVAARVRAQAEADERRRIKALIDSLITKPLEWERDIYMRDGYRHVLDLLAAGSVPVAAQLQPERVGFGTDAFETGGSLPGQPVATQQEVVAWAVRAGDGSIYVPGDTAISAGTKEQARKVVARCQGRGGEWSVVPLVVGSGDQTHGG